MTTTQQQINNANDTINKMMKDAIATENWAAFHMIAAAGELLANANATQQIQVNSINRAEAQINMAKTINR